MRTHLTSNRQKTLGVSWSHKGTLARYFSALDFSPIKPFRLRRKFEREKNKM
jgi:hypothetical protein